MDVLCIMLSPCAVGLCRMGREGEVRGGPPAQGARGVYYAVSLSSGAVQNGE